MLLTDQLLAVLRAYCSVAEIDTARASQRCLGDRRLLVRLEAGRSTLTLTRADRAIAWFSRHWPDGAEWPSAVPRPSCPCEAAP